MKFYFALLLVVTPYFVSAQKQGQPLIDSLLKVLSRSKEDTNKVKLLTRLSFAYSDIDPDAGISLGQKALSLSQTLNWSKGIAEAILDLGVNYEAKADHSKALEHYKRGLNLFEQLGDKNNIAKTLADMALVQVAKGNYPEALEYDFKALNISDGLGQKKSSALILENIGIIYFEQKEYSKTTEYYANALKIYSDIGDKESIARNLGNVGIVLAAKGEYAKAIEQHLKAFKMHEALGDINSIQVNLANAGDAYNHLKNYPQALSYQLRALRICEQLGNRNSIAINLGNIGETYLNIAKDPAVTVTSTIRLGQDKQADLRNAISYLGKAVGLCEETNFSGPLIEFSQNLSEAYFLSTDYKHAFESLKQYMLTKDSVFSLQNKIHIVNLEEEREEELRGKETLIKGKQIEIQELTISKKHSQQLLYIACIILLLLIMGIVLRVLYVYRRSNSVLLREEKRHLLLIEEQIDRLKKQTSVLREISHMQAHDVRGPVATILGLVQVFNFDNLSDPGNKVVIEGIAAMTETLDAAVQEVIKKENNFSGPEFN